LDGSGWGIAVDAAGAAYVTGETSETFGGYSDAFVTKINAAGTALVYSTHLGGSGDDGGERIAVDAAGAAYVTGSTTSTTFPNNNAVICLGSRSGASPILMSGCASASV